MHTNSQQIANARDDRVDDGPHRIHAEPPGTGPKGALLHHHHVLLDAVLAQHHVGVLGQRVAAEVLGQRRLPVDHDVASVELAVEPPVLLPPLGRQQPAEEGRQEDEEDARRRVRARRRGRPPLRVERRRHDRLEHRHHARRVPAAAHAVHARLRRGRRVLAAVRIGAVPGVHLVHVHFFWSRGVFRCCRIAPADKTESSRGGGSCAPYVYR